MPLTNCWIRSAISSIVINKILSLLCVCVVICLVAATTPAQKRQPPKKTATDSALKEQLNEVNAEIAALLARVPGDEEQLQQAMTNIKSEMRLRELRWRAFDRGPAVDDEPFQYH